MGGGGGLVVDASGGGVTLSVSRVLGVSIGDDASNGSTTVCVGSVGVSRATVYDGGISVFFSPSSCGPICMFDFL